MDPMDEPSVKYRIKSYHYDEDHAEIKELLFTIEEVGQPGDFRQYAREITVDRAWERQFSDADVAKIYYAKKLAEEMRDD